MSATKLLAGIQDTAAFARFLADVVKPGDCLALSGEVGAGKTTFAQYFISALLASPEPITSPTYTLMQEYVSCRGWSMLHVDLYRLENVSELAELGLAEHLEHVVSVIEWPDIAASILPDNTLHLRMESVSDQTRQIMLYSEAVRWNDVIKGVGDE